ncbi:jg3750, partial [Pararge aegeria aegeria]
MNQGRHFNFLQTNINHSAGAQDLLMQSIAEWEIDIAVVCEPYFVPSQPHWVGDTEGLVAIVLGDSAGPPLESIERGPGYAVAKWRDYVVVGIYFSPNRSLAEFEIYLDSVRAAIFRRAGNIVVLGDFNAKSQAWGSPRTDERGRAVQEWALTQDLSLLNRGTASTCVRQQGGSIVDLSFATASVADRVVNWRVEQVETLADHNYIRFEVSTSSAMAMAPRIASRFPRWCITRLDRDLAKEAAILRRWTTAGFAGDTSVDELADSMHNALTVVCEASMPRARGRWRRRHVYWWTTEIADLRIACNRARRAFVRSRRRNGLNPALEAMLHEGYRVAKNNLRVAISQAKELAHKEMLERLNKDPWGRPYRVARNKLRTQGAAVTETLQPNLLIRLVGELFPDTRGFAPPIMSAHRDDVVEEGVPPITEEEWDIALNRLRRRKTAPGPDGVPGRVVFIALESLGERMRKLFDKCLHTGRFPKLWKEGKLCLIRKEGRPLDSAPAYRPIVLLSETGKLLEKIIVNRLNEHIDSVGPGLSDAQFGFREGRSTLDALEALKHLSTEEIERGRVVLAVSLDVRNAFNSLPFETLLEALKYHRVPLYLRRLLEAYLQDRVVAWEGNNGRITRHGVHSGVPQGSVLGPVLWNIGFDWLLRGPLLPGMRVICYADDTLITASGDTYEDAARLASVGSELVANRIRALGLQISASKTEAILFHGPRKGPPRGAHISIHGVAVEVRRHMKYLGLVLDGR